jgi:hypothetical protein
VTFAIVGGNAYRSGSAFSVSASTGQIRLASVLNFEFVPNTFLLSVRLSDDGTRGPAPLSTVVVLNVTVVDENDNPLLNSSSTFVVDENTAIGAVVYRVVPSDEDVADTGAARGASPCLFFRLSSATRVHVSVPAVVAQLHASS